MRIDILTLFPEMCYSYLNESVVGRARKAGALEIECTDIRDYTVDKHNRVDDAPYGGGMGMIMQAQPVLIAIMISVKSRRKGSFDIFDSAGKNTYSAAC